VTPEREHLTGWQGAESQAQARTAGAFSCPSCGEVWSEQQRIEANLVAKLLHESQSIGEDGTVTGPAPQTDTLGFRWSAVNNLFLTGGDVAADEWRAAHASDEELAEREMRQFVWCLPVAPSKLQQTGLEAHELTNRMTELPRGTVPDGATCVTVGLDLGKYLAHWIAVAWSPGACGHVLDYGRLEVASEDLGVEQALLVMLRQFKEELLSGWPMSDPNAQRVLPEQVWVDAGYMAPTIYSFCREAGERFRPSVGRGAAQQTRQWYNRPTQTGSVVKFIGEGYHACWLPAEQLHLLELDADHWKTWVHQRLATPVGGQGAMTLFRAQPQEHLALAKHLTAESKTEEFVAGKGVVVKWERLRRQNHWFDALYNACAAGHGCGVRLVQEVVPTPSSPRRGPEQNVSEEWLDKLRMKPYPKWSSGDW
jgi:hypothetical protein